MNLHFVSSFVLVGHWLIIVSLSVRVIMRRPPVGVSMAWLAVIFSVPFVGAALYLLFGEKRLGRRRAARINANVAGMQQWQTGLRKQCGAAHEKIEEAAPLDRYIERVLGCPVIPGNEIELLHDFQSIFDAIVRDIDAAKHSVCLCFYVWRQDGRTEDVVDALIRAAQRGVQCRALADATGSKPFLNSPAVRRLREAGVEFSSALPTGLLRTIFARADLRNHRKIIAIDDRVAYVGSQNLVDPRFFGQDLAVGEWVDAMARITGPAASSIAAVFALDWSVECDCEIGPLPLPETEAPHRGGSVAQIVPSGPGLHPEAIHQLLLMAIYGARKELIMTTPYFVPDESILTALLSVSLRGVDVTLIVPARNDSLLVRHASTAHFDDLLSAGANIALFKGGLLHTKSLTIDGEIAIFGSVNLDMRSLWLNFEVSMFVYDPGFAGQLRTLQNTYLEDSTPIRLELWRQRPAWRRFVESAFRLLGPLL